MDAEATNMDRKQVRLSHFLSLASLLAEGGDDTLIGLNGEEERHHPGRGERRKDMYFTKLQNKTYFV